MAKCKYWQKACPRGPCPENTDVDCNIIKPKPELKRIKAWAHPDIFETKNPMVWVAGNKSPVYSMSVVITECLPKKEKK